MPDTASLKEMQRLHPLTLVQRFAISLPGFIVILLPLRSSDPNAWFTLFAAVLYGTLTLPFIVLQYLRFRYRITPRELVIRSGVLKLQTRNIPIERIQNIEIEQSLLPRLLGTAKVKIETAGSTSTEGVLEYVSLKEARTIRQVIRSYQRREPAADATLETPLAQAAPTTSSAAETTPPTRDKKPLFTMSISRVLLSGAFRFSLLYIALIFSGLEYLNLDPEEIVNWFTRGRFEWVTSLATASPWLVGLTTIVVVALLAWLTGIAINLNRFYNFQLTLEEDKLHKRTGLLTLSEGTIPLKKVQGLILRTNPLMRAFDWFRLELQTMGLDVQQYGHQVAVPFAQREEVAEIASHIRPVSLPSSFQSVSVLTIRRRFVRYTLLLLLVVLPTAYFWKPVLWALVGIPFLLLLAVFQYRNHGYAVQDDFLYVRRGVFRQYVWMLPVERFQVFYQSASIFQRRLGLSTVYVDTGGASSVTYPNIIDLPAEEATSLLDDLYARFQSQFERPEEPASRLR